MEVAKTNNKHFILNRSDLEGKFVPEYYHPTIRNLEFQVRKKTTKKLKDFIVKIASGATPSVQDVDKFYSNKKDGVPFLRVQNLKTNGKLDLEDVKHINKDTHNNYLKRSQVKEGNLLIKITGVGRMAVASVAPTGFIGNTNQHMVVVDTGSTEMSNYLANYLNLDLVEKLATRRSTGGTRPALDYTALKSIPIIENLDFSVIVEAEKRKQQKETQAKDLLKSIDTYILNELGITIPETDNSQENRMFIANFSDVVGGRIDPKLYDSTTKALRQSISNSHFSKIKLKELIIHSVAGDWGIDEMEGEFEHLIKCLVIRATEFDNKANLNLDNSRVKYRLIKKEKLKKIDIQANDLLIEKSGGSPDQPVGRIALITSEYISANQLCYSNFIHKIRVDDKQIMPEYLFYFLKTIHNMKLTDAMQSQTNGIRNLIMSNYFNQEIVLPENKIQNQIVTHIKNIQQQITALQSEANSILENAKAEVEKMILG